MTPSPENNEAGRLLDMEDEQNALRAEHERVKAELVETKRKLDNFLQQWIRIERQVECEPNDTIVGLVSRLRAQLTNAIDERNIARKESTALAEQLATVTKERDYHKQVFLSDWKENEAALEKAGIDFTPDESGGKPVIVGIEELIAQRDEAVAQRRETDAALASIKRFQDEAAPLRQRVAELEAACSGARQALLRDDLTETFIILDAALVATAPDAQSTPPNP